LASVTRAVPVRRRTSSTFFCNRRSGRGARWRWWATRLDDGPALAGAHVSFAFGRAVPLAQSQSDFVVLGEQLAAVSGALLLARRTTRSVLAEPRLVRGLQRGLRPPAVAGLLPVWASRSGHGDKFATGWSSLDALRPGGPCTVAQGVGLTDILYLLIPLSVALVFFVLGGLVVGDRAWPV
jgi:hypothetical protein